ncbi:MAG: carbamoyltransferase HypF [Anaerolineales bacterium]|nr:carbamoyltransferase HypF [Anaerolineales bacterium]
MARQAAHVTVGGLVQGVGFRPFVYRLAREHGLAGWVRNTTGSVEIAVEGEAAALAAFVRGLREEAPPLAQIGDVRLSYGPPTGQTRFEIRPSVDAAEAFQPVAADTAICPDCLRELFDPHDRRYRYPFINCTHCGPRLTIITALPYDRPNTTMATFALCRECAAEYADPGNRRFHAQPTACPRCGPRLWLTRGAQGDGPSGEAALRAARAVLAGGGVLAVKGLGGFHLACRADDAQAVRRLRERKQRGGKPLALMTADREAAEALAEVSPEECALLESRERPIVVLRRRPEAAPAAAEVAPGQDTLGVMLPYTPLHYLLLEREAGFPTALVMTSGNLSSQPLITDNAAALRALAGVADAFLLHDRDIQQRCDDSVVRLVAGPEAPQTGLEQVFLRRARGYAPRPVALPVDTPPLLATGAELKNTFALARGRAAYLSPHVGDLENFETLEAFEAGIAHFEQLFRARPEAVAYDLHPDYLATRYALERAEREGLWAIGVQHHHAHIAAAMADAGLSGDRPVIGLAADGTGYGPDGAMWGGEVLVADYAGYERANHLTYALLPGGDAAVREPWRMALAWLWQAGLDWTDDLPPVRHALADPRRGATALAGVQRQLARQINAPRTSSLGRLFDAVAALSGVCQRATYEGQAAIELEAAGRGATENGYSYDVQATQIDAAPVIRAVAADARAGVAAGAIAARFHAGTAAMLLAAAVQARRATGLNTVALSGGVWQNATLLRRTRQLLRAAEFEVVTHRQTPANDGGLALGQAAVAAARLAGRAETATVAAAMGG